jgi:hypothetical protein
MNSAESFSEQPAESQPINCAETCVNGCILGEQCPNQEYRDQTAKFIQDTPLDQMLTMAEEAIRKKRTAPPQWVYPED